jgi:hypothetical protein
MEITMRQKRPLFRYKVINRCLRSKSKKHWTSQELLKKLREDDLPVELRTLRRDIQEMCSDPRLGYLAPIKYSKKHEGYYYENSDYTIELNMTPNELDVLTGLVNRLKEYV